MQGVMRLLYGSESVGSERLDFYHLHTEIRAVETRLRASMAREPSQWELVSAAIRAAADNDGAAPRLAILLRAYQGLEDATLEESLGAEARLADQVYRLSARRATLCRWVSGLPPYRQRFDARGVDGIGRESPIDGAVCQ